jgi:TetR/AcrR family transcriptional regulator, cholesterol catabolism regulator
LKGVQLKKNQDEDKSEVPSQIKNSTLITEKRKKIVNQSIKLFIKHGYHKTTTRMIAKATNFSTGSLYEYISSKDDLLYLVCKGIHEEIYKAVNTALGEIVDERRRLTIMIKEYILVCDKLSDHISLMYKVTQFLPDKWKKRVLENEIKITNIFIKELIQLKKNKNLRSNIKKKTLELVGHDIAVIGQMWAFRHWHIKKKYLLHEYIKIQTDFILGIIFTNSQN